VPAVVGSRDLRHRPLEDPRSSKPRALKIRASPRAASRPNGSTSNRARRKATTISLPPTST
jgi:hypothetical protein